ncbi:hypothetical protein EDB85DRAFT_2149888 [Lactarius pseudohatsudake]|nr:hypothetical protein EDB85DRAFT_2149888 [Lactarius pseudohatsudake]
MTFNLQLECAESSGIVGVLDRLGAYMLSANEQVAPEPSRLELFLPAVLHPSPSVTRKPDPLTVQRPALSSPITSGLLTTGMRRPSQPQLRRTWTCSSARPTSPALSSARPDGVHDRRAQHGGRRGVCVCTAAA